MKAEGKNVRNVEELRDLVRTAKGSYFVEEDFTFTYAFLKTKGYVSKTGRFLKWVDANVTPAYMEYLINSTQ